MTRDEWTAIVDEINERLPDNRRGSKWTKVWYEDLKDFDADRVRAAAKLAVYETRGGSFQGQDIVRALGVVPDARTVRDADVGDFDTLWDGLWTVRRALGWPRPPELHREQAWLVRQMGGWVEMGKIEEADLPTWRAQLREAFIGHRAKQRLRGLPVDGAALGLTADQRRLLEPPAELRERRAIEAAAEDVPEESLQDYGEQVRAMLKRLAEGRGVPGDETEREPPVQ